MGIFEKYLSKIGAKKAKKKKIAVMRQTEILEGKQSATAKSGAGYGYKAGEAVSKSKRKKKLDKVYGALGKKEALRQLRKQREKYSL